MPRYSVWPRSVWEISLAWLVLFTRTILGHRRIFFRKVKTKMISKETKTAIIAEYKINENDTGSPEVQVAILTDRINGLTEHMKKNPKDFHSQRGLSKMVGHRKQLLNYLAKKDIERYRSVIKRLGLRK